MFIIFWSFSVGVGVYLGIFVDGIVFVGVVLFFFDM